MSFGKISMNAFDLAAQSHIGNNDVAGPVGCNMVLFQRFGKFLGCCVNVWFSSG